MGLHTNERLPVMEVFSFARQAKGVDIVGKHDRIVSEPGIMLGKPVIRGTRVPVELLVRKLGDGASVEEMLEAYPNLKREDIFAALKFAADSLSNEEIVFLPKASGS